MARKVFNVYANQLVSTKEITVVVLVIVWCYIAFLWDLLGRSVVRQSLFVFFFCLLQGSSEFCLPRIANCYIASLLFDT